MDQKIVTTVVNVKVKNIKPKYKNLKDELKKNLRGRHWDVGVSRKNVVVIF